MQQLTGVMNELMSRHTIHHYTTRWLGAGHGCHTWGVPKLLFRYLSCTEILMSTQKSVQIGLHNISLAVTYVVKR